MSRGLSKFCRQISVIFSRKVFLLFLCCFLFLFSFSSFFFFFLEPQFFEVLIVGIFKLCLFSPDYPLAIGPSFLLALLVGVSFFSIFFHTVFGGFISFFLLTFLFSVDF